MFGPVLGALAARRPAAPAAPLDEDVVDESILRSTPDSTPPTSPSSSRPPFQPGSLALPPMPSDPRAAWLLSRHRMRLSRKRSSSPLRRCTTTTTTAAATSAGTAAERPAGSPPHRSHFPPHFPPTSFRQELAITVQPDVTRGSAAAAAAIRISSAAAGSARCDNVAPAATGRAGCAGAAGKGCGSGGTAGSGSGPIVAEATIVKEVARKARPAVATCMGVLYIFLLLVTASLVFAQINSTPRANGYGLAARLLTGGSRQQHRVADPAWRAASGGRLLARLPATTGKSLSLSALLGDRDAVDASASGLAGDAAARQGRVAEAEWASKHGVQEVVVDEAEALKLARGTAARRMHGRRRGSGTKDKGRRRGALGSVGL